MSGSIAGITFDFLLGEVQHYTQEIETITKPGEDGFIRRGRGLRARPFTLNGFKTYSSKAAAEEAFNDFHQWKTDDPKSFVKDSVDYTTTGIGSPLKKYKVAVLEVEKTACRNAASTTTGNDWILQCDFTLQLVPIA